MSAHLLSPLDVQNKWKCKMCHRTSFLKKFLHKLGASIARSGYFHYANQRSIDHELSRIKLLMSTARCIPDWRKLSKENFLFLISIFASSTALIHGYITCLSDVQVFDDDFIQAIVGITPTFENKFIVILYAGEVTGSMLSYIFSDSFGRLEALKYGSLFGIATLLWNAFSYTETDVLTSRFLLGWSLGFLLSTALVYLTEVSTSHERGCCIGLFALMSIFGSMIADALCYSFSPSWEAAVCAPALILISNIMLTFIIPESPRFLLARKTPVECLTALRVLRRTVDVGREFNDIYLALTADARLGESWADMLGQRAILFRVLISCAIPFGQRSVSTQLVAMTLSHGFSTDDWDDSPESYLCWQLSLVYFVSILGTCVGLHFVDNVGRRMLAISGCVTISLSWLAAALCIQAGAAYYSIDGHDALLFPSAPLRYAFGASLCVFAFGYSYSLGVLSWIAPAELFPFRVRAKATGLATACNALSAVFGKYFLDSRFERNQTALKCSISLGVISLVMGMFMFVLYPETKDILLEDMEELFAEDSSDSACCGGYCPFPTFFDSYDPASSSVYPYLSLSSSAHSRIAATPAAMPMLGFRSLAHLGPQKGGTRHLSLKLPNAGVGKDGAGGGAGGALDEDEQPIMFDPTHLHKYSGEMRDTNFSYFNETDLTALSPPPPRYNSTSPTPTSKTPVKTKPAPFSSGASTTSLRAGLGVSTASTQYCGSTATTKSIGGGGPAPQKGGQQLQGRAASSSSKKETHATLSLLPDPHIGSL